MKKNRNTYLKIVIPVILLCMVSFIVLVKFQKDMEKREYRVLQDDVKKYAELGAVTIERTLEGYITTLKAAAESMKDGPIQTNENMNYLKNIIDSYNFMHLGISDLKGNVRVTDGRKTGIEANISDRYYFSEVIRKKDYVVTEIENSKITGQRVILAAVPIFNQTGEVSGILLGTIRLEDFRPYENLNLEDTQLFIQVIDQEGNYIVSNGSMHLSGDTSSFDGLKLSGGELSADDIIKKIRQREAIVTERSYGGSEYIVCFEPLQLNKWYMVVSVDKSAMTERVSLFLTQMIFPLMLKITGIMICLCGLVIFYMKESSRLKLKKEEKLRKQLLADVEGFLVLNLQEDKILRCTEGLIEPYSKKISYSNLLNFWKENLIEPEYAEEVAQKMSIFSMIDRFKAGVDGATVEYPIRDGSGKIIWRECVINVKEEDSYLIAYSIHRNISNKKQTELLLKEKAEKDYLTGLYNRRSCVENVNRLIQKEKFRDDRKQAFVLIDLDNFKSINDKLGHQVGDRVLQDTAHILTHHFREYDVVCRFAGDEFVVLLEDVPQNVVKKIITALLNKLKLTYTENSQSVSISASIGIAFIPDHGMTFEEIYMKADKALYLAKENGRNTFCIFNKGAVVHETI